MSNSICLGFDGMFHQLRSIWNQFGFWQRSRLRWRRGGYRERWEPKENLFEGRLNRSSLEAREKILVDRYGLEAFRVQSNRSRYLETLTYLDFLEALFQGKSLPETSCRWLDVGVKNWSTVEALHRFLLLHQRDFSLDGIELDTYRVYADFYSRYDYATAYIQGLPNTHYHVGDVMMHTGQYDVVSCFLPFVVPEPCFAWGLPQRYFKPLDFLEHLIHLLSPSGTLLIVNQGEAEAQAQAELFKSHPLSVVEPIGQLPESFLSYRYPRYGWYCRK
jgi:hypothetical protein